MPGRKIAQQIRCSIGRTQRTVDPALEAALTALRPIGIVIGHRLITPGDEDALRPAERTSSCAGIQKVRRQSGAARTIARELLARLGFHDVSIPRSNSGAPIWPPGVVGSVAHDNDVAVAAIADAGRFLTVGVDVEPADPLPPELVELVATSAERERYSSALLHSRVIFAAKEAIYKAV